MPNEDLENRILELMQPFAAQLAEVLRTEALADARREILSRLDSPAPTPAVLAPPAPSNTKPRRNGADSKRHLPAHCVYPGCPKPQKGPRFSFMCNEHMGLGKRDKAKFLTDWKVAHPT